MLLRTREPGVLPANPAFGRALESLAHPLSLLAAFLLLANALWLQPVYPSWVTGKIGDAAWLFLAPLLASALLAWVVPARHPRQIAIAGSAGILLAGGAFVLVKTLPAANQMVADGYTALTGLPAKLQRDPSDLLALPGLLASWLLWRGHFRPACGATPAKPGARLGKLRSPARAAALGLSALALLADSPNPRGFYPECLATQGNNLLAFTFYHPYLSGPTWNAYGSTDSGRTWHFLLEGGRDTPPTYQIAQDLVATPGITSTVQARDTVQARERAVYEPLTRACQAHDGDWKYASPSAPAVRYRFTQGKSIERTADGGQTWRQEYKLGQDDVVSDAVLEAASGNLLCAVKGRGVLVRTPSGAWQWAASE